MKLLRRGHWLAVLAVVGPAASCTSAIEQGFEELNGPPTTAVIVGSNQDAGIVDLTLEGDSVLVLAVTHGSCDELEGWVDEGDNAVVVGVWRRDLTTVSDDPDTNFGCADVGQIDPVWVELAAPLGDQRLVVVSSDSGEIGSGAEGGTCLTADETGQCHPFTLRTPQGDTEIAKPIAGNPTGLTIGSGRGATLAAGDLVVDVATTAEVVNPLVVYRSSVGVQDPLAWGEVLVHNDPGDRGDAEPLGVAVDGREAFLMPPDEVRRNTGGPPWVLVPVGPWSVEVRIFGSTPEAQREATDEFLANLTIVEVDNAMPVLVDGSGWLVVEYSELSVRFDGGSFGLSVDLNCDRASDPACQPGLGSVWPADYPGLPIGGGEPDPDQPWFSLPRPDDLAITIVDLGTVGELVACSGAPAFDPALLPSEVSRTESGEAMRTYTGVSTWRLRFQPGIQTWYTGDASDPEAVATEVRNEAGLWSLESVTVCQ